VDMDSKPVSREGWFPVRSLSPLAKLLFPDCQVRFAFWHKFYWYFVTLN
jgi:hypothetical protein